MKRYDLTIKAAFAGYVVQAVVNNFLPLLFIHMQREFGIPLSKITLLIMINFLIQLLIDLTSTPVIERIGYRASMLVSNASVITGFIMLTWLPGLCRDPFYGILGAVCIYAIGGGLQEVLVSPIVEACPTNNKEAAMSLLHSAYCWGHVAVVILSTVFFRFAGISNWRILALLWCLVPTADFIMFTFVPIAKLESCAADDGPAKRDWLSRKFFWIMMLMMLCAGASEQAVSQWASAFAEAGLGIPKQLGDLLGPMLFAVCMGTARTIYGIKGHVLDLKKFIRYSIWLCLAAYLVIALVPNPVIALLGFGLAGFAVGIFWPGTFSLAAANLKNGGTLMFALLALAGDLGCAGGPAAAGFITSMCGGNMRVGIGAALIFPLLMGAGLLMAGDRRL